jgi:hypothetical protein
MFVTKWFRSTWKMFLFAHAIPVILFQRKEFLENPRMVIKKILIKFLRSQAFVLSHAAMCQVLLCKCKTWGSLHKPHIMTPGPMTLTMLLFTTTIFFEAPSRIEETMLWVMPRFWEQSWNQLNKLFYQNTKKNLPTIPGFYSIIYALSIASLCGVYNLIKKSLKSKYLLVAAKMVGDEPARQKGPKENDTAKTNPFLQDTKSINVENSNQQMSRIYYPFTNNIFR